MNLVTRAQDVRERLRALPLWVFDSAIAVVLLATSLASTAGPGSGDIDYETLDWFAYVLILVVTVPYVLRRRYPFAVFCVSLAGAITFVASSYNEGTLPIVLLVGMYAVGAYCASRLVVTAYLLSLVGLLFLLAVDARGFGADDLFAYCAFFGVAALFGWNMQSRRLRLVALEERADALERERDEQAKLAVADERLRIAQELHDVMAHSMSVIAVQAGAGMHVVEKDPAQGRQALENISTTSRSTLTELRRLLGVLRDDGDGASYAPAPGLADLDRLVDEVTAAGVPVDVTVSGDVDAVPAGLGFTGYRIVQEALTNVLKHAGPARVEVRVEADPGHLRIDVRDDGRGVHGASDARGNSGHGLVGMRERVAVYGGTLRSGPAPGGGYRLEADLPYDEQAVAR